MADEYRTDDRQLRANVIVVGSITADVTAFSERLPRSGETVLGDDLTLVLGGKGANQAVACARAGSTVHLVGCIGNDMFSELILRELHDSNVDLSELRTVEGATGVAHIRVDASGQNNIVVVPLANTQLSTSQVDAAFERLADRASVLLAQLEVPVEVVAHAIRMAHCAGLTVILDPAPAVKLDPSIWKYVTIVTPNESEASSITGIAVTDYPSAVQAGRWFCAHGSQYAIITLAEAGAAVVTASEARLFSSFSVDVVDTTAAGDAFTGYLGSAIAEGLGLDAAIQRAMAAGALAVTKRGASPSLPQHADVSAFLSKFDL